MICLLALFPRTIYLRLTRFNLPEWLSQLERYSAVVSEEHLPMLYHRFLIIVLFVVYPVASNAQNGREVMEVELEASVDEVWDAFTTTKGLKTWVAPLADIDLRIGGKWRANYDKNGKLGDPKTIVNTILCYDPKRMISLKATGFPEGFQFADAAKDTWSIFYFTPINKSKTKVTIVGLGYNESEQSKKMRAFFKPANKYSMDQLKAALKKKRNAERKQ